MNRFDLTPYRRSMVGFDRLFDMLENQGRANTGDNYPPFNIEKLGGESYRITLAVAGFKPDDIDITAQQNLLVILGKKSEDAADSQFLHVGIAQRGFERRFELADYVKVRTANLEDGMLVIDLEREAPESMKPKKIAVGGRAPLSVVEGDDTGSDANEAA
ncbi:MAG: Hsp20 family protein [Novosphingobium sp.]|nr:Hsp20 family protein [Novosphingobium sp.]